MTFAFKSSTNRRQFQRLALASVALGLVGCATAPQAEAPAAPAPQQPIPHPLARPLPLIFKTPELREALNAIGLLKPFTAYWTAYAQRDWSARYDMEKFQKDIERFFYVNYHHAAWWIESFQVTNVHPADSKQRVRIEVEVLFRSIDDPKQSSSQLLQDWWMPHDQRQWQHMNSDPMLNDLKPAL